MEPIIKFENLSVVYDLGKSNETWALRDVAAEIYPEEYIIFFGPSGCGKSTLLYTIAGLEFPTRGKIIVNGKDLKNLSPKELINFHRSTIGMVFQAYYLIPTLNVRDNILLPQIFARAPSSERLKKAKLLMERFGILHLQNRKISQLSGGQQQRVAIARALIQGPPIILADEPVGNLDSKNAEIVLDLLEELNQKDKKTIIHVTHNPRDLHRANRVFYMKDGKIIREVVNTEKPQIAEMTKREISELERLAQAYPYLTETRLRAKLILNHLLLPFGIDVQQKIEEAIERYIKGEINQTGLFEILDAPPEKGGVNLYTQRAKDLSKKIANLAEEIKIIEEEKYPILTPAAERAKRLRTYLLDNYQGKVSFDQIKRLDDILTKRIIGKIRKKTLERLLDLPLKDGGAGFNRRTAKRFARQIELILMKS
jgi:putative ABC transport system ATP-binding protein